MTAGPFALPPGGHRASGAGLPPLVDDPAALLTEVAEDDDRYAGMIDGRAIHFFFLLIEPVLVALHPHARQRKAREPRGRSTDGAFCPRLAALAELERLAARNACRLEDLGDLRRPHGMLIASRRIGQPCPADNGKPFRRKVRAAFRAIDRARLSFFVDLGVGCILPGNRIVQSCRRGCVPLDGWEEGMDPARSLLRGAAGCFFGWWLEAESALSDGPPAAEDADLACRLFEASVAREFGRRLHASAITADRGHPAERQEAADLLGSPEAMLLWLERLQGVPLCRELLAGWYPGWRRSTILFRSPFNTLRDLKALHAGDRR